MIFCDPRPQRLELSVQYNNTSEEGSISYVVKSLIVQYCVAVIMYNICHVVHLIMRKQGDPGHDIMYDGYIIVIL